MGNDVISEITRFPVANAVKAIDQNVTGVRVPLSGHWIPEEQPQFVIGQLLKFFVNTR
jgi:pimeloyl-ACP methyl ester carboxylesterase